jgi:RimJ/RimL family protein N-acetyltransferase
MLKIKSIESLSELNELKKAYFESATAPLDGMWHFGFVPMAKHFGFYAEQLLIGYCCINDEGYLLQFYLKPNNTTSAQTLFTLIAQQNSAVIGAVKGAFVSTAEPSYLSLCLDNSSMFEVHSLMYQQTESPSNNSNSLGESLELKVASEQQLTKFVDFAATNIGAPKAWLNGYYANLINRKELFGYWVKDQLLAAGECRLFDEHQCAYADLGLIVAKSMQGQGLGKKVLDFLTKHAASNGLQSICSTEKANIAAHKAISAAGFESANRIIQFEFVLA